MTPTTPHLPDGCTVVEEVPAGDFPALIHPLWGRDLPWLIQGTTFRGPLDQPLDLGLFSDATPARAVMDAWTRLRVWTGADRVVHAHQVHEATVRLHDVAPSGMHLVEACDGHATARPGTLLAVTVADCVPVSLVAEEPRCAAMVHAGWRGAAQGILEEALGLLEAEWGVGSASVRVHLGPSICGRCYEVGPEVFRGLGLPTPEGPTPLDLRAALARRALEAGVGAERISVSAHCTLCGPGDFFSHRGGDGARQVGFLGLRR